MAMGLMGWGLLSPMALVALGLPLGLILLSARRQRPQPVALGTARFFDEQGDAATSRRRWRVSGARWWAAAAMTLGVLAAGGPQPEEEDGAVYLLTAHVDRSPSMFLPADPTEPGGELRIDQALRLTSSWLTSLDPSTERAAVRWRAVEPGGVDVVLDAGEPPPRALRQVPRRRAVPPRWGRLTAPGAIFVTDQSPPSVSREVGVFASGGAAVPGPVAIGSGGLLDWGGRDGAPLVERAAETPIRVFISPDLPAPLIGLAELWAAERGFPVGGSDEGAALSVRTADPRGDTEAGPGSTAGRDGWTAAFRAVVAGRARGEGGWRPWLSAPDGPALVWARSGEIEVAFRAVTPAASTAEAFALSWARLFDSHLQPPPEVVGLDERRGAGAPASRGPQLASAMDPEVLSRRAGRAARGRRVELVLLVGAGAAGLLAFALRLRGSP